MPSQENLVSVLLNPYGDNIEWLTLPPAPDGWRRNVAKGVNIAWRLADEPRNGDDRLWTDGSGYVILVQYWRRGQDMEDGIFRLEMMLTRMAKSAANGAPLYRIHGQRWSNSSRRLRVQRMHGVSNTMLRAAFTHAENNFQARDPVSVEWPLRHKIDGREAGLKTIVENTLRGELSESAVHPRTGNPAPRTQRDLPRRRRMNQPSTKQEESPMQGLINAKDLHFKVLATSTLETLAVRHFANITDVVLTVGKASANLVIKADGHEDLELTTERNIVRNDFIQDLIKWRLENIMVGRELNVKVVLVAQDADNDLPNPDEKA